MKYTVQSIEPVPCSVSDYQITVVEAPHWFERLFGAKVRTRKYEGSCTIWRDVETGEVAWRLGSWFSELVWKYKRDQRCRDGK